jgi:hypothetical protein
MRSKWFYCATLSILAGAVCTYGLASGPSAAAELNDEAQDDSASQPLPTLPSDSMALDLSGRWGASTEDTGDNDMSPGIDTAMMTNNVVPPPPLFVGGDWHLEAAGTELYFMYGGLKVARLSVTWDRLLVFRDLNGAAPYFYFNQNGGYGYYHQ